MISLIYGIPTPKNEQTKQKQTHRYREQFNDCQMEGGFESLGEKGEGIKKYKLVGTE